MKEKYEEKYDAHILTHQRHMLISWLESAKSEKIKAVKKQVVIPTNLLLHMNKLKKNSSNLMIAF